MSIKPTQGFTTNESPMSGYVANEMSTAVAGTEDNVTQTMEAALGDGEITTSEALQLQLDIARWSLTTNLTSQALKSMQDGTSAIIRNVGS